MDDEANNQPPQPMAKPNDRRVIKPSASIIQELEAQKQQAALQPTPPETNVPQSPASTVYPEPINHTDQSSLNAPQHFALTSTEVRTKENDRPVCLRVKSVMVVAALGVLAAAYGLLELFAASIFGPLGAIMVIVSLIQFGMSIYLFVGKDHNTAALIVKIYLVFQLISLFLNIVNPIALLANGAIALFLFYVYTRVKSLSYY